MRLAGWIMGGTMAALLLAAPAGGSPDLLPPNAVFFDDLSPGDSSGLSASKLQRLAVTRQFDNLVKEPLTFRMIALSDAFGDADTAPSDFAVMLNQDGDYKVMGVQLPFASSWYRDLLYKRAGYDMGGTEEQFQARLARLKRLEEETSVQQFLDTRPVRGDSEAVRVRKLQINHLRGGRRMERCEAPIPNALASRALQIFGRMVRRTQHGAYAFEDVNSRLHISRPYRFQFEIPAYVPVAGEAASTLYRGSRPDLMVQAGMTLHEFCRTRNPVELEALTATLNRLEARLEDGTIFPSRPGETRK